MRKILSRALVSAAFIALLFYLMRNNIPEIVGAIRNANHGLIALAVSIFVASTLIFAKRLQLIFRAENIQVPIHELLSLSFIGYFFNNFLPTSVGGDIVKTLCAARLTKEPMKSVTTILMDRIFGLFTFVVIPSVSLLFFLKQIGRPRVVLIVYSFFAASLFCFALIFNRNLARKFGFVETLLKRVGLDKKAKRVYDGLHDFKNRKLLIFNAMALSVVGQLIGLWIIYLMGMALGAKTAMIYFFLLVPVIQLMSMVPSLGGLGPREVAYVTLLGPYIGKETAAALGIVWLGQLLIMSLIGGIIYLLRPDYHIRLRETTDEPAS